MGKRIAVKTALITIGIFLIINSIVLFIVFKKYPIDSEKYVTVVVAIADLEPGTIIQQRHVRTKRIQLSASNEVMEKDISSVIGKKTAGKILKNDYLRNYDLVNKENWYASDDRIIIVPVNIEERLANLIKKNSYIDILLKSDATALIETILKKVKVEEMLDENGNPIDAIQGINSKTAYMKLVLGREDRQKIYTCNTKGQFIYELYCDENQD